MACLAMLTDGAVSCCYEQHTSKSKLRAIQKNASTLNHITKNMNYHKNIEKLLRIHVSAAGHAEATGAVQRHDDGVRRHPVALWRHRGGM